MNRTKIKQLCKLYEIENYTINDDNSIDVNGDVNISCYIPRIFPILTSIPLNFNKVSGIFDCSFNKLTSLEGSPKVVGNHFDFSTNYITSFKHSPISIGGDLSGNSNKLNSTSGLSKDIGGDLLLMDNDLTIKNIVEIIIDSGASLTYSLDDPNYDKTKIIHTDYSDECIEAILRKKILDLIITD